MAKKQVAPKKKSASKKQHSKTAVKGKHPGGRPSLYKPEYATQVLKFCLLGATDKEIADFFNVAESTVNKWKLEHPEFSESIKKGKLEADANVASSLYNRAIGFTKKGCEEIFMYKGEVVRAIVTKYFPPDVTAQVFHLKNRQPSKWRDRQVQSLENPDGTPLFGSKPLSKKQIKKFNEELEQSC
jgi:hypothetical protein